VQGRSEVQGSVKSPAPNILLNLHPHDRFWELCAAAILGVLLQLTVLIIAGLTAYYPRWKEGFSIEPYEFDCTIWGTLTLTIGLIVCTSVVDRSTKEKTYVTVGKDGEETMRILWLQRGRSENDASFDPCIVIAGGVRKKILTSRRFDQSRTSGSGSRDSAEKISSDPFHAWTLVGILASMIGFIVQFIGLTAMHWPAQTAQLAVTLIMTGVRAFIRRGPTQPPRWRKIFGKCEMDWLATVVNLDPGMLSNDNNSVILGKAPGWEIMVGESWRAHEVPKTCQRLGESGDSQSKKARDVLASRKVLGDLCRWQGPAHKLAISVATAIEEVMKILCNPETQLNEWLLSIQVGEETKWPLSIQVGKETEKQKQRIYFTIKRVSENDWKSDDAQIEAALSLGLFHVYETEIPQSRKPCIRLLGRSTSSSRRDLQWWLGPGNVKLQEVWLEEGGKLEIEHHRIVGFGDSASDIWKTRGDHNCANKRGFSKRPMQDSSDQQERCLAAISETDLKLSYAQHMFSAFMWTIAKHVGRVPGDSSIDEKCKFNPSDERTWKNLKLKNSTLEKLAQCVQRAELGDMEDGYLSIIPPLSMEKKLPTAEVVVEKALEIAVKKQSNEHWDEAYKVYHLLFQICMTFGAHDEIAIKATALFTEFFRSVSRTAKLQERQNAEAKEELDGLKEKVLGELKEKADKNAHFREVMFHLGKIYDIQGGLEDCDELHPEKWEPRAPERSVDPHPGYKPGSKELNHAKEIFNRTDLHDAVLSGNQYIDHLVGQKNSKDILGRTPLHYAVMKGDKDILDKLLRGEAAELMAKDFFHRTVLHYAACGREKEMIHSLLKSPDGRDAKDRDAKDRYEMTALLTATESGNDETVKLLLGHGANKDAWAGHKTVLHIAAERGYTEVVKVLLDRHVDITMKNFDGRTALHLAALGGHHDIVELLEKADFNATDEKGRTVLHLAALSKCVEQQLEQRVAKQVDGVVDLLIKKVDRKAIDYDGRTALHLAALYGQKRVVDLLIEKDIEKEAKDVEKEAKDYDERTALHLAARYGQKGVVDLLIENDVEKEAKDYNGRTALYLAARYGQEGVVDLLIEKKVDKDSKDKDGRTPLSWAAENGHEDVVQLLLKREGVKLDSEDKDRRTPLSWAAENGRDTVVRLLLERKGVKPDSEDKDGRTPLSWAAENGREDVVRLLLEREGVEPDSEDMYGRTPLSWAAENGRDTVVRLLLEREGVKPDSEDKYGRTPLSWAAENGRDTVMRLLLEREGVEPDSKDKYGQTPLSWAAENGRDTVVRLLLECGNVDLESKGKYGRTPLSWAAANGHMAVMRSLLQKGADVKARDGGQRTALQGAAKGGHKTLVQLLLEKRADVNAKDKGGFTALHGAAGHGDEEMAQLLLDWGADVKAQANNRTAALHLAVVYRHKATVRLLLENGADVNAQGGEHGSTALHWAADHGDEEMAQLLLDWGADVKAQDRFKGTAQSWAERMGRERMVRLLKEAETQGQLLTPFS
jgi:ankyrin repeat protein